MGTISEHSFDFRTIIRMHDLKTNHSTQLKTFILMHAIYINPNTRYQPID